MIRRARRQFPHQMVAALRRRAASRSLFNINASTYALWRGPIVPPRFPTLTEIVAAINATMNATQRTFVTAVDHARGIITIGTPPAAERLRGATITQMIIDEPAPAASNLSRRAAFLAPKRLDGRR